jgi:L,D-peptidoglycan transpeptidase YkuD (ErfK/YbiS/YcfS/YnhG family)
MASSSFQPIRSRPFTYKSYFVNDRSIIVVRRRPGNPAQGLLSFEGWTCLCALGRSGVSARKREGDGASPRGRFPLRRLWLRPGAGLRRATSLPLRITRLSDGWCDDVRHRSYNRPVHLPFPSSHEKMWRDDGVYDGVVEIGWNDRPAVKGRGSAIFMHLARPGHTPTEGCVALARRDMARLLPRLSRRVRIDIA